MTPAPTRPSKKPKVIFLCTHNQARSQMAESLLRALAGDHFEVYSAGFEPRPIHPLTHEVMAELGYDLTSHESTDLKDYLGKVHFGIVITVCEKAEELCPTFPGVSTRLFWPVEDPATGEGTREEQRERFRAARDALKAKIEAWLVERGLR